MQGQRIGSLLVDDGIRNDGAFVVDELLPGDDWREMYARLTAEWPVA